jgi:hypothetical protein
VIHSVRVSHAGLVSPARLGVVERIGTLN